MSRNLKCTVEWHQGSDQTITFAPNDDCAIRLYRGGPLGPNGLSSVGADLAELAASIFWIERRVLRRRQPPRQFTLVFPARDPGPWTTEAVAALSETLRLLGNAVWDISVVGRTAYKQRPGHDREDGAVDRIALFSGGLDSTSGIATVNDGSTRLVSFYTRQRTMQERIAKKLGHAPPVQFRLHRTPARTPGRSFRYRSLFFLCLAAAAADSWGARRITQFENGVLATAIPPSPAWLMTKHAHPRVVRATEEFLNALFDEAWEVDNPFLTLTKRQCVAEGRAAHGDAFDKVARTTESCWHKWSNHVPGGSKDVGKKTPGQQCGICIPCLVRATALDGERYKYDMSKTRWKNHERFGRDYRAYYALLDRVRGARTPTDFYRALPAAGRTLWDDESVGAEKLRDLFVTFSAEFMETFGE